MELNERVTKDNYYLDIAETVAEKSTCLRRHYGAVIVKNDEIIATGYNGSPRGCLNCTDDACMREELGFAKGRGYNICGAVHAEMNAVISASRRDMIGGSLYIVGINVFDQPHYADPHPCLLCHRMICNTGISRVIGRFMDPDGNVFAKEMDITPESFMIRMQNEFEQTLDQMEMDITPDQFKNAREHIDRRYGIIKDQYEAKGAFPNMVCEHIMKTPSYMDPLCKAYTCLMEDTGLDFANYPKCAKEYCPKVHPELLDSSDITT